MTAPSEPSDLATPEPPEATPAPPTSRSRPNHNRDWPVWLPPVATATALGVLALTAWLIVRYQHLITLPPCGMRTIIGLPCPSCGGTRSMAALAQLDLLGAVTFNPAVPFIGALVLLLVIRDAWRGGQFRFERAPRLWIYAAIFAINWAYLIWAAQQGVL